MIVDFARALRQELDAAQMAIVQQTGMGGATDWAAYRYQVGVAHGLQRASQKVTDMLQQFIHDEELQ